MFYVIYNPSARSGKGAKLWEKVKTILDEEGKDYRVYKTTPERDASYIVKTLLMFRQDTELKIMLLGGDGTLNEAIQSITENDFKRIILYYLPTGSSNDLAKAIGYTDSYDEMVRGYVRRDTFRNMDLGIVRYNHAEKPGYLKRYFAVSCGIGYDASVCEEANNSKIKKILNKIGLGKLCYLAITVKQLIGTPRVQMTLKIDDNEEYTIDKAYFAAIMNHRYQGGGLAFCPDAVDDDGILDICHASDIPKAKVLSILPTLYKGEHVNKPGIKIDRLKSVSIKSSLPLWVHTDGEVRTKADDITVEVLPGILKFATYKD